MTTIKVKLDTKDLTKTCGRVSVNILDAALNALSESARHKLFKKASEKLSIEQYKRFESGFEMERGPHSVVMRLTGDEAVNTETGVAPYDLKPGMLKSKKAKRSKKTKDPYMDVPMSHRTSQRGHGTLVPSNMRQAVQKAAKEAKQENAAMRIFKGGKGKASTPQTDMVVKPEGTAQTFRRVSKNSDPSSWIHPGTKGIGVFTEVAQEIEQEKGQVIADIAAEMTK